MFNQDLLKKIIVLYVEDDSYIRTSMIHVFEKLFKQVFMAEDGKEGLDTFTQAANEGITIDVVISDINMPNMNGLEMIKEIRKINKIIPFVLTTAHAEAEYFLESIKLGVTHYAVKPLEVKDLILQIQDISLKKYQEMIINNQNTENKRYIELLNKIAIVSKTDLNGNITFVNDIFCQVSGYSKEELLGASQNIVRHPDVSKQIFIELWNTLKDGKSWHGKIKNKTKNGDPYIVNATIFPVFDEMGDTVIEYMGVRFVITEEENEKREFKKKVINNIQTQKQKEKLLIDKVNILENKLHYSAHDNIKLIQESLELEREKTAKAKGQLFHYENELKQEKQKVQRIIQETNARVAHLIADNKANKEATHKYKEKALSLQLESTSQKKEVERLAEMLEEQAKMIKDLKDVITHREEQLKH